MDSVSQLALGAAVGVAVMGRRTAVWKAAAWGAVCGTLPDLDALIDHGDPIRNMTLPPGGEPRRLLSDADLAAARMADREDARRDRPLSALVARACGWRWSRIRCSMLMTVYGTQLALPFSDRPFGVGSIFIIDPLYTLPLLIGVVVALSRATAATACALERGRRSCSPPPTSPWGVRRAAACCAAWRSDALAERRASPPSALLVTPTPLNTRAVARRGRDAPDGIHEGFYSLLDRDRPHRVRPLRARRDRSAHGAARRSPASQRIAWFSAWLLQSAAQDGARVLITDLRMGQEPFYTFNFVVGERHSRAVPVYPPIRVSNRMDFRCGLP